MLFCTTQYAIFLSVVLLLYWGTPWKSFRIWLLVAASFCFYATWNLYLALLVLGTATIDYLLARGMDYSSRESIRKGLVMGSIGMNLGILILFKYLNFFLESLSEVLQAFGAESSLRTLEIIVPVAISFYTFEAINYAVEVYRRKIPATKNLGHFLLFILFFPHLVAGPIVRARDFLPQIERDKIWSWTRASAGLALICLGVFKKLAIADRLVLIVDPVFANVSAYATEVCWAASVAFALQVYCDFSGYSDIALGSGYLLGYKLAINFRLPFLAVNIADFWRRWHISLSSWLRDYVFFPLGGSRGSAWRVSRNLIIVMTLGGLWHGANWNYITWGALQGVLLASHRFLLVPFWKFLGWDRFWESAVGTIFRVGVTFTFFCLGLAIFRSHGLAAAGEMLSRMFVYHMGQGLPISWLGLLLTVWVVFLGHFVGAYLNTHSLKWLTLSRWVPSPVMGMACALLMGLGIVLAPGVSLAFVYFQF